MNTGVAPALEPKVDTKTETSETSPAQPVTLKRRIEHLLHQIFAGREDHAGWHQWALCGYRRTCAAAAGWLANHLPEPRGE